MLRIFNTPLCFLCPLCTLSLNPIRAPAQAFDPAARAAAIAPLVDDQTVAVAHVDLERLDAAALVGLLGEIVPPGEPNAKEQLPPLEEAIKGGKNAFRGGRM